MSHQIRISPAEQYLILALVMTLASGCSPTTSTPVQPTVTSIHTEIPVSSPTPGAVATPAGASAPQWTTFRNLDLGFSFKHPPEIVVETQTKPDQVLVYIDPDNPFYFQAARDYLPGEVTYFLDTAPSGTRTIGQYAWSIYLLPDGYCDGPGCSPTIYALRMEKNLVLFTVIIYGQSEMTELQESILSTFDVLD